MVNTSVAIVMMDSRRPTVSGVPFLKGQVDVEYPQLSAWLNARYACAHGYSFVFFRMRGESCRHPAFGERHPSYCKLAALSQARDAGMDRADCP